MGLLRRILRSIGRAIATYNPAPLDRPTDYDLGRGRLYMASVDKDGKPGPWHDAGPCYSFRITLKSDSKP